MSGLAKYLLENGCEVSGSDIVDSKYIDKLRDLGAEIYIGQKAENVPSDAIVVASTAIKEDNPEMIRAKELKYIIASRYAGITNEVYNGYKALERYFEEITKFYS